MIIPFLKKIFGTKNERYLKTINPLVGLTAGFEPALQKLSDTDLKKKTVEFRERLAQGETLDQILPEAFAVVRETSRRVLNMRHFDVQIIGGVILHQGKIAEMKTGEGKTLVATLPVYLNALTGKGVHVVTVNDYLARRDAEWMGQIYKFLGLSVGVIVHGLNDTERKWAYNADVTYGTNNEFGFDYLRDNMKYSLEGYVQREMNYAIVDEVDSILIDEARTPLIISGPSEEATDKYYQIDRVIPGLVRGEPADSKTGKQATGDYTLDEKSKSAMLTEQGVLKVEKMLGIGNLYDPENIETLHHVNQSLKAHTLFKRDVDYVVKDDQVIIVDEFTGRLMPGRRWSDGLHQAVEAKEKVKIESENQTLATITFQNYFRMYKKLSGMTGTADTESAEFAKIYNLDVVVAPTHRPMIRTDHPDVIYKSENEKFHEVVEEIIDLNKKGRPVLVGTISIEKSEHIASLLKHRGVAHHVLNAKHHEREAEIVAQAGRYGAVTISTNMAGRGTDILLGGNPESLARAKVGLKAGEENLSEEYHKALEEARKACEEEKKKVIVAGGLHILGTERHEARRIDNQLRGRSGRQGDPGSSRFYLSLEDDLMRIFGSDRIKGMMEKLGMEENEPIEHPWITKAIANAQKRVEAHNFEIRKNLIEYDDVMNQQRTIVYRLRREILEGTKVRDKILDMFDRLAVQISSGFVPAKAKREEIEMRGLEDAVFKQFDFRLNLAELPIAEFTTDAVGEALFHKASAAYEEKEKRVTPEIMRQAEKVILLSTLDTLWKDHLLNMDHLREGIGLRGYGQKDPLLEYKREGYEMFQGMIQAFTTDVVEKIFRVQITEEKKLEMPQRRPMPMMMGRGPMPGDAMAPVMGQGAPLKSQDSPLPGGEGVRGRVITEPSPREGPKIGRNDPCPCGSGKKYKKCCGR
ncbi:MAG: preprotein translocase subunit SecA [Deltaproteobacteria bacterium]|nr:preprotein translocase subunit SecA [Deltaproteobacteria bacterium]